MRLALLVTLVLSGCSRADPRALLGHERASNQAAATAPAADSVSAPPPAVVQAFRLSPQYVRYVDVGGMPVLGTAKVHPQALLEAAYLVRKMIGHRPDALAAIANARVRFVVMATSEMTTDIPEHSDLTPRAYWDKRARGLGATDARPAVSCGEENLLEIAGDPYSTENILVHEFSHVVHEIAMRALDPTFDARVNAAYESAKRRGLWRNTYAMENHKEYWAEAAQSWFDTNRSNDSLHGEIDTRDEVKRYDPDIARLLTEAFGDGAWRYQKPSRRVPSERAHLRGFEPSSTAPFAYREAKQDELRALPWVTSATAPKRTPVGVTPATSIVFVNRRSTPIAVDWLDTRGALRRYVDLQPSGSIAQSTYVGHVWVISDANKHSPIGTVIAAPHPGRVEVN